MIAFETVAVFGGTLSGLFMMGGTLEQALVLTLCYTTAFYFSDMYDPGIIRSFAAFLAGLPRVVGFTAILMAASWGLLPGARVPAEVLGAAALVMLAVVLIVRSAGYEAQRLRPCLERVVVLGQGSLARLIREGIEARPQLRMVLVDVGTERTHGKPMDGRKPFGLTISDLDAIITEYKPQRIICASTDQSGGVPIAKLLEMRLDGIAVDDGNDFYENMTGKVILEALAPGSFVFGARSRTIRLHLSVGRAISMAVSAVGLAVATPLFLLIAIAIRIDSAGPIFYVQERIGLRGRRYKMLKFRTMQINEVESSMWAQDNGHRITRVGTWLRQFRLDELPQFINILLGDMNLVGPRPHPASNVKLFTGSIPHYELRHAVRPGVTGWAQTQYRYANNLAQETEKVRYDFFYIKHMSTSFDLRILFDTIKVVLLGRRSDMTQPLAAAVPAGEPTEVRDTAA
jgi:exopolysaccharide biosynthesis polyprenyl glycosylphosphotransferase